MIQALIVTLIVPLIPLGVAAKRGLWSSDNSREGKKRYLIYLFAITLVTAAAMLFLCDEGTSFMDKVDMSPSFLIKYLALEMALAIGTAFAEWLVMVQKLSVSFDAAEFRDYPITRFVRKVLAPAGNFILAAGVLLLNLRLIFDNVLWGDEAYSADLIRHPWGEVLQLTAMGDNHPPLYYLWLKLWAETLGYRGEVYHFASYLVFAIGIVLAIFLFRKKMGNIPLSFFLIITGLSASCLEYNVEIRMYALAFLGITFAYYSAYCALKDNKWIAWIGIAFFGWIASYTHYYALMMTLMILFLTVLAALILYKRKSWVKPVVALLVFVAGYAPMIPTMIAGFFQTTGNWWMTEPETLPNCLMMIFGGIRMEGILMGFLLVVSGIVILKESGLFRLVLQNKPWRLEIHAPYFRNASAEAITLAIGLLTIIGTLGGCYLGSALIKPMVAMRYVYPLLGIVTVFCVIGASYCIQLARSKESTFPWLVGVVKAIFLLITLMLLLKGIDNYREFSDKCRIESEKTGATIGLIESVTDQPILVNNGVTHIGWTVLQYYFPKGTVTNSGYSSVEADDFWYFTKDFMSAEELEQLTANGYQLYGYGEQQIAKYPFVLYRFQR
jgi:uncharacterized membrane protein